MVENIEDCEYINSVAKKYNINNVIKINLEYEKIVPSLTPREYDLLKSSIKESGENAIPIIVNQDNIVLDGHNRFKACQELGITPKIEVMKFPDPILEKEFIITINLNRRHLNSFQIAELGYQLEEIEREKAKKRQLNHLKNVGDNSSLSLAPFDANEKEGKQERQKGKVSQIIANKIGQPTRTYERNRKIIEEGSDEQKERLRQGKVSTNKVYNEIVKAKKIKDLLAPLSNNVKPSLSFSSGAYDNIINSLNLIEGDFSEKGKEISKESIDLIVTDPPYSSKNIQIYHELGDLASRVLKSGGSLVTYIGQHNLPEILNIITSYNLTYRLVIAVKLTGSNSTFYQRNVIIKWKPLLWFIKGEELSQTSPLIALNNYLDDFIESKPPEKILHPWEQSTVEAEHVMKKLTLENQIVLDPMMGSGTTGITALSLKRKFIGIEKDHEKFLIAKTRFHNTSITKYISN